MFTQLPRTLPWISRKSFSHPRHRNSQRDFRPAPATFNLHRDKQPATCDPRPTIISQTLPISWIGSNVPKEKPSKMHCNTLNVCSRSFNQNCKSICQKCQGTNHSISVQGLEQFAFEIPKQLHSRILNVFLVRRLQLQRLLWNFSDIIYYRNKSWYPSISVKNIRKVFY